MSILRPHQKPHAAQIWNALQRNKAALDGSDTGTGKTFSTCAIAQHMGVTPLVVCPKTVIPAWQRAAEVFGIGLDCVGYEKARGNARTYTYRRRLPGPCKGQTATHHPSYSYTHGDMEGWGYLKVGAILRPGDERFVKKGFAGSWKPVPQEDLGKEIEVKGGFKITEYGKEIAAGKGSRWEWSDSFELMIFDEVDRCAGDSTLASKMLIAAKRQAGHVLGLSATAAESPLQMKALGYALGLHNLKDWQWWLYEHGCRPGVFGGFEWKNGVDQTSMMDKLHRAIFPSRGARMQKALIPGFPKTQIEVMLLPDEKEEAQRLSESVSSYYALRKAQRDQALGAAADRADVDPSDLDEDEEESGGGEHLTAMLRDHQALEHLMIPHLADLVPMYSQRSKVLVFLNFSDPIQELAEHFTKKWKRPIPVINGEVVGDERQAVIDRVQRNEEPLTIVNNTAGGVGTSLHDPQGVVERTTFISSPYSARKLKQIFGRAQRDGGAFSQQFILAFQGSSGIRLLERVKQKSANIDALNDGDLLGV